MQFYIYQFIQHHWPAGCFCLKIVYVHDCFWRLFECFICGHLVLKTSYARAWLNIGLPTFGKMEEKCFCSNQQLLVVCMFVWFCIILVFVAPSGGEPLISAPRFEPFLQLWCCQQAEAQRCFYKQVFDHSRGNICRKNSIFSLKIYRFFTKKKKKNSNKNWQLSPNDPTPMLNVANKMSVGTFVSFFWPVMLFWLFIFRNSEVR